MGASISQFFPPSPAFTERNVSSQAGRVFIVTGGASGIGFEISRILYNAGGKVYIAGRSEQNALDAITRIKQSNPPSSPKGEIHFLMVSLDDLTTIKPFVEKFNTAEPHLDVLFNNAGVSHPPADVRSPQGHELQMATNCLGPYLLTQLLKPKLLSKSKLSPPGAVRVVWTSSIAIESGAPLGGILKSELLAPPRNPQHNYTMSKVGNWFLASEFADQVGDQGVLSVAQNPGNLKTSLTRHLPRLFVVIASPLLYKPVMGAYTALWSGLSNELTIDDGGAYIVPWGRRHPQPRQDLLKALKSEAEGGTGQAKMFREYCEEQTTGYR